MWFGLDGTEYAIDLNKQNARAFRKQLAPFIESVAEQYEAAAKGR